MGGKGWGKSWSAPAQTIIKYVPVYKGSKGWGGKSSGKGRKGKKPYSELSEEKKEEIKARHQARADDEGRAKVGNAIYEGVVVKRFRKNGWIKPTSMMKLPKNVQAKIKEMNAESKSKAEEHDKDTSFFDEPKIYLRMCDVTEGVLVQQDAKVKFKVYMDEKGVGAYDVKEA